MNTRLPSRDPAEILRQRQKNRHLKEARRLRMDDEFSTRGQEQRDPLLGPSSDFSRQRRWSRDRERKAVRVSGHLWILGQCEVVPEEDRTVREIAGPQNRGRRRVR